MHSTKTLSSRSQGVLYCLIGALLLTPDALIIRWLSIEHHEVLFWRGLFFTFGFFFIVVFRHRGKTFRAIYQAGWAGVISGFLFAMNTYFYTQALQLTSAAAAMMIISTAPVFAAIVSWLFLKERISLPLLLTITCTLLGMGIILSDGDGINSLKGNLMAMGCAIFMALNFNWARYHSPKDITPGLVFGGLMVFVLGYLTTPSISASTSEIGFMFLSAAFLMPIGFVMLQIAPKYISATEVSLFLLLESVIAPIWVWIGLGELPSTTTLLGSLIVLIALIIYNLMLIKKR
ncbi:hypothetical protein OA92_08105 [Marinomonas sp. SBI22]|uniref:DMT family transporter n=1 Tax=unclassified Marinomonas TaxID=196814 RepID=UPI0007AEF750|nr:MULTISPECIES: DMT family transporter [unclassified Marinomonas]KZM43644.1 hypothetical protein OA92_08105 [Marinomonas sp. SBI22]KZM47206.1 hypothetical protein OA91_01485 [Marinomonas sp. SBI8L]